jgi:hypothetical protein
VPLPAAAIVNVGEDENNVTELNFTEYIGQIEDKLIYYMGQYNMYKEQIHINTGGNGLLTTGNSLRNSVNTSINGSLMIFPDDDIPEHLRNPPSPSAYSARVNNSAARRLSNAPVLGTVDDAASIQSDMTSISILERINTPSKIVHPSELNIETGEDHATMMYHGTAVHDDRPMSKAEITNSAIHTIRQHRNSNSAPRKGSTNSSAHSVTSSIHSVPSATAAGPARLAVTDPANM